MFLKRHLFITLLAALLFAAIPADAQFSARLNNARVEFVGVLNGQSTVWESRNLKVSVQKGTGIFEASLPLAELTIKQKADDYEPMSEEERQNYTGAMFRLSGTLPVDQISRNINEQIQTVAIELNTEIGDLSAPAIYVFRITSTMQDTRRRYRIMADGMIDLSDFDLPQLEGFEHEIRVAFDFAGM
jgi:hypothetical protein